MSRAFFTFINSLKAKVIEANYYYMYNAQGDVIGLYDNAGNVVCRYYYDAWSKLLKITDGSGNDKTNDTAFIGYKNPIRYRAYYYDNESGMYYLQSRYYNPDMKRFINADDSDVLTGQTDLVGMNMFAYCTNDPVNNCDDAGYWKLPNWAKVAIGVVATAAAVAVTVATGGAAAPILIGVAASTVSGAAIGYATGGKQGMIDGAVDGFMWGGIGALASSAVSAVKAVSAAKKGVTIGQKMEKVTAAATVSDTATYKAMKGYNVIKKVAGEKIADKLSYAHNKSFIKRMMRLGAPIYDNGPNRITSMYYAMERVTLAGYWNYVRMW